MGARWSTAWAAAGFVNGSTAVPANAVARLALVGQLINYFTANPTYAVATMDVTAAKASALQYTATMANNSSNGAKMSAETKKAARSTAETALRAMLRGLIGILLMKLGKADPRWLQFGLNIPAANSTPSKPGTPTVVVQPASTLVASCPPVPLATRFRWRIRMVGVDEAFRLVASTIEPLAEIKSVLPGQTVDLLVEAVNGGAAGPPSDIVRVVLPLAVAPTPAGASLPTSAVSDFTPPETVTERVPEFPATLPETLERSLGYRNGNGAHAAH